MTASPRRTIACASSTQISADGYRTRRAPARLVRRQLVGGSQRQRPRRSTYTRRPTPRMRRPFARSSTPAWCTSASTVADNRLTAALPLRAGAMRVAFETRIDLAMPSCDGVLGRYVHEGAHPGRLRPAHRAGLAHYARARRRTCSAARWQLLCSPPARVVGSAAHDRFAIRGRLRESDAGRDAHLSWAFEEPIAEIVVALEIRRQTRRNHEHPGPHAVRV